MCVDLQLFKGGIEGTIWGSLGGEDRGFPLKLSYYDQVVGF